MDWIHSDTSPEAEAILIDLYRRMSTVEKARKLQQAVRATDLAALFSARFHACRKGLLEGERT